MTLPFSQLLRIAMRTIPMWLWCSSSNTASLNFSGTTTLVPHNIQSSSIDNSDLRYQYGRRVSGTSVGHPCLIYLNTLLKIVSQLVAVLSCVAVTGKVSICCMLNNLGSGTLVSFSLLGRGKRDKLSAPELA